MDANRKVLNRLEGLSGKALSCAMLVPATVLLICTAVGSYSGPPVLRVQYADVNSFNLDFISLTGTTCRSAPDGSLLPRPIPRCWSNHFVFPSRFIQYFDVQLRLDTPAAPPGQQLHLLPLQIQWLARNDDPDRGAVTSSFVPIYSGNVSRPVVCNANDNSCWPVLAFKTSTVGYSRYYAQISIAEDYPIEKLQDTIGPDVDVIFRYRNPDFSLFELGFKVFFMLISLGWTVWFIIATGCDWGCCPAEFHAGVGCCTILCRACCCRGRRARQDASPMFVAPMGFHGQARVNWMYVLLISLVFYNEPLLWANYYAPYTYARTPADNGVPFFNVAGQLFFVAMLLSYWIVEFGLLAAAQSGIKVVDDKVYDEWEKMMKAEQAARAQAQGQGQGQAGAAGAQATAGSEPEGHQGSSESAAPAPAVADPEAGTAGAAPGAPGFVPPATADTATVPGQQPPVPVVRYESRTWFYLPKILMILLYWFMAMLLYGHIMGRTQADPLYDWVAEGTELAKSVGAEYTDNRASLVAWTAILMVAYLMYFFWLLARAVCACKKQSPGERFLFAFHVIVVIATCFGLAGSAIYSADVTSPTDFTFFMALFNVYVWTLAWLYSPQVVVIPGLTGATAPSYGQLQEVADGSGISGGSSQQASAVFGGVVASADSGLELPAVSTVGAPKMDAEAGYKATAAQAQASVPMFSGAVVTGRAAAEASAGDSAPSTPPRPAAVAVPMPLSAHASHGRIDLEAVQDDLHVEQSIQRAAAGGAAYHADKARDWGMGAAAATAAVPAVAAVAPPALPAAGNGAGLASANSRRASSGRASIASSHGTETANVIARGRGSSADLDLGSLAGPLDVEVSAPVVAGGATVATAAIDGMFGEARETASVPHAPVVTAAPAAPAMPQGLFGLESVAGAGVVAPSFAAAPAAVAEPWEGVSMGAASVPFPDSITSGDTAVGDSNPFDSDPLFSGGGAGAGAQPKAHGTAAKEGAAVASTTVQSFRASSFAALSDGDFGGQEWDAMGSGTGTSTGGSASVPAAAVTAAQQPAAMPDWDDMDSGSSAPAAPASAVTIPSTATSQAGPATSAPGWSDPFSEAEAQAVRPAAPAPAPAPSASLALSSSDFDSMDFDLK